MLVVCFVVGISWEVNFLILQFPLYLMEHGTKDFCVPCGGGFSLWKSLGFLLVLFGLELSFYRFVIEFCVNLDDSGKILCR